MLKASLRFSFPQLLLVAFVLIGALLGAAAVRTLFSLDTIMAQSRESTTQAIALSTAAQSLSERSLTMERAARQALVLGDRQLRQRFEEAAGHARDILRRLESNELPPEFSRQWLQQLSDVEALLDGSPETALDRERAVARAFRELDGHSAAIAQQVQAIIGNRNDALQDRVEKSRRQLTQQVLGSIALAAVMALGFGVWLARPFQRLEKAIVGLGENRLDLPIDIPGPPDVRRVSQQLEWLRLRLTELDADKARFLRHVSHELKTPLASLHEGVAVLGDGVAGPLSPSQAEVVSILQHNTQLLQHQIEALLRFNAAAFEARQLRREPTDLLALVEEQIETQRLRWQSHQLSVRAEGPSMVLPVDREKMASAIGNLLSNAIRFSPQGGLVRLVLQDDAGRACLDVIDQGPGVAEADRDRVFEPFYRGERQPTDTVRGTGIGLSIVHEYIGAHGGRVQLLPARNGAHFRIELPHAS
ncbi:MAG TPA: two-component sensor histidine kinase [Hydrogenophaga sp.]|nr:two-component sensor histidine kinase [Gammaproteobacteria bacterium]OGA75851.1 MAG: two-component sensor histidine kinase [Burkholderiales bacterium GWE1_65_30]OGA90166.1 MAG: two-component sensor histidine kinase [Burkholderiales bacterium GWF1_66_17]OGB29578.1 MAG: two-component sensor histidine kinase [Burkholderiales bacterium RIFCSPLOWO2_02_FULL_66_35]OGB31717.1 MAG: two-component sensor histidine kinase [Burkholderiales bacterium RIFCSPHIGHO2_02_FULL_66_10]PKO76897.1 MAG: two-compone